MAWWPGLATLAQYILLLLMVEGWRWPPVVASAASFSASALFNYLLNYYFTFSCNNGHLQSGVRFGVMVSAGLVLNTGLFWFFHHWVGLFYVFAQVFATVFVFVFNFLVSRYWAFKSYV